MEIRLLVLGFALISASAFAERTCPNPGLENPFPEVENAAEVNGCVGKDDFSQSCAYRRLKRDEAEKDVSTQAKEVAERTARVFDPNAQFGANEKDLQAIQTALKDPEFLQFMQGWSDSERKVDPAGNAWSPYSDEQKKIFRAAIVALYNYRSYTDVSGNSYKNTDLIMVGKGNGSLEAAIELLANLPKDKRGTLEEKKSLIEKIATKTLLFKAEHSTGCNYVTVERGHYLNGFENFGKTAPVGTSIDKDQQLAKEAESKSAAETEKYRSVAGAGDFMKSCSTPGSQQRHAVGTTERSCDVDLPKQIFPDNEAKLTDRNQQAVMDALEKDSCYQKMKQEGLPIARVSVATSASSLHNTRNYCKWDFEGLSRDRAHFIKSAMKKKLGDAFPPDPEKDLAGKPLRSDQKLNAGLSFLGGNGDGTSGDCAYSAKEWPGKAAAPGGQTVYEVKDGGRTRYFTEERKPEYASPKGEAKLEENKYAKVTIYYADKSYKATDSKSQWSAGTDCLELRYVCR